jgi:hypothetical protein
MFVIVILMVGSVLSLTMLRAEDAQTAQQPAAE